MKGFLAALKKGTEYSYIAKNGYQMSKDELTTILKEYIYQVHSIGICGGKEEVIEAVYENLSAEYEED